MKCRKCGREADSNLTFCPSCGTRLGSEPDLDEITVSIADKVDLMMNEEKAQKDENKDGIRVIDGQMVTEESKDKTTTKRAGTDEISDSVYDDISKALEEEAESASPYRANVPEGRKAAEEDPDEFEDDQEKDDGKKEKGLGGGAIAGIVIGAVLLIAVIVLCIFMFGPGKRSSEVETESESSVTETISCSVSDGQQYTAPVEITLESSEGNRMYYTLDGSTPSISSSLYSGSITIDDSYVDSADGTEITLRVVTYTDNSMKNAEFEVSFTVVYADVEAPVISPESGTYTETTYITISAESGAKIYYTTDGTTPTTESNLYTGQFEMERGSTVVSAIAVKNGISSSATTAVYDLEIESVYTFSQAQEIVLTYLLNRGTVNDSDGNTDDGYVDFMDEGTCIIDNDQYIVVAVNFYDEDGDITETVYYGVDDQTGTSSKLTKTDSGYTK